MKQSLKVYFAMIGYWGLLVIVPIALNIVGIYQLATGEQFIGIPSWVWFLTAFVLLLIIPFIGFHKLMLKLNETQNNLDNAKNARPSVTVEPTNSGDTYFLKVTNLGEQAVFKAQISLEQEDPSVFVFSSNSPYQACWANTEKYQANIFKGHSANIKLAKLHSGPPSFTILTWYLYYCDTNNQENYVSTSSYPIGAYYVDEAGNKTPYEPVYKYRLHVIISSIPSLRDGAFHGEYVISYQGKLEELMPKKEDS